MSAKFLCVYVAVAIAVVDDERMAAFVPNVNVGSASFRLSFNEFQNVGIRCKNESSQTSMTFICIYVPVDKICQKNISSIFYQLHPYLKKKVLRNDKIHIYAK